MDDIRKRLYSPGIKINSELPLRGQWAKTARKEILRKRKPKEEKKPRRFW